MRNTAIIRLHERLTDARRLIEIHEECTGLNPGRRAGYDALNRSTVILAIAAWEGFIEDLLKSAVEHIAKRADGPSALPVNVRDALIAHQYEKHGWGRLGKTTKDSIWALTGRGWRLVYIQYAKERITALHTPNYENVRKLYSSTIGLTDFAADWGARRWTAQDYMDRLDKLLVLRHRIAHGQIGQETVGKGRAQKAVNWIDRICGWTDKTTARHARD